MEIRAKRMPFLSGGEGISCLPSGNCHFAEKSLSDADAGLVVVRAAGSDAT